MREYTVLDNMENPIRVTWNEDAVVLVFELGSEVGNAGFGPTFSWKTQVVFDGKEALQLISFLTSL